MTRRSLAPALSLAGLICLTAIACDGRVSNKPSAPGTPGATTGPIDVGGPRFVLANGKPAPWPKPPAGTGEAQADPIVVPLCHLVVPNGLKQDVPSQTDGYLYFVGVEMTPQPPENTPADGINVFKHPRTGKYYQRLHEGMNVQRGQIVALLDDRQAHAELISAQGAFEGAKEEAKAAAEVVNSAQALYDIQYTLSKNGSGSKAELAQAKAGWDRSKADRAAKVAAIGKSEGDQTKASVRLQMHEIRSTVDGKVKQIYRRPGEAVKGAEVVMQIENRDRIRVEGYVDLQNVEQVKPGTEVLVEPSLLRSPLQSLSTHQQAITCLAVSSHRDRPLVLSASEDRMVHVWDRRRVVKSWAHPVPVRAVACTPPGAVLNLALTGADDGKARLWDLNSLGDTPLRELDGQHQGGIQSVAFSPDGKTCVTADERDVFLWDTESGKKLYAFPAEHRGPITCVHFLPQSRVVTVSKDNMVRVWMAGEKAAKVEKTFEHRSGEVNALGVTPDGGRLLFDQDKARMHVLSLPDGLTEGVLTTPGEASKFTTFAAFSPEVGGQADARVVLTAGSNDGVLQLWRMPTAHERGGELVRLVCTGFAPATCAAFSPHADGGFVVVGTQTGRVDLWPMPTREELNRRWVATVMHVEGSVEPNGRNVKVWAEMKNDGPFALRPGTTATMVIPPKALTTASR